MSERVRSDHRALFDEAGAALRYTAMSRPGAPMAASARVPDGRTATAAARAAVDKLPGWIVQTEDFGLAAALIKAGARPVRHAFTMQCDLRRSRTVPPPPAGLAAIALDPHCSDQAWAAVLPSWHAAYPSDHPDHFRGDDDAAVEALRHLVRGAELGPLHGSSVLVQDAAGQVLGGIIVTVTAYDPPWGGPWVGDVWRDPALRGRGVGPWLLGHVQSRLAADGFVSLGLAVSAGNPARQSYEAAGFRVVAETQMVQLPPSEPDVWFPGQV